MKKDNEMPESKMVKRGDYFKPSLPVGTLLKVNEVAEILRLKPETIRAMARRGDLPAIKLGRVWRFRKTSISDLLEER